MSESGFTLMEMLMVLMIVMLLSFIAIPVMYDAYNETEIKRFFDVFDSDVRFIQNQAFEGRNLSIYLDEESYQILENKKTFLERDYPEAFMPQRFPPKPIRFWNTGTIKNPSTYFFRTKNGQKYKVVFPFGKGRQYIETM